MPVRKADPLCLALKEAEVASRTRPPLLARYAYVSGSSAPVSQKKYSIFGTFSLMYTASALESFPPDIPHTCLVIPHHHCILDASVSNSFFETVRQNGTLSGFFAVFSMG